MDNRVLYRVLSADGSEYTGEARNLRTQSGANWQADLMGAATSALTAIRNIALTQDTTQPASTMTNLASEIAADGLSRKTATYAHTANASTYTQSAVWSNTSTSVYTIARAAMAFSPTDTNDSADTHFLITALNPVAVLNSSDTLSIDWGVTF